MHEQAWEIIPLVPLPARGRQAFTYRAPPDAPLEPGLLVRIPLGPKTVRGVVWRPARSRMPRTALKTVQRVLSHEPLFTSESFGFLKDFADASLEPFSALVKAATSVRLGLGPMPQRAGHRTARRRDRLRIAWEPIDGALSHISAGPILVLVPELAVALRVVAALEQRGVSSAVFAQSLPSKQRRAVWQRFMAREASVLVTTHAGILLPFPVPLNLPSRLPSRLGLAETDGRAETDGEVGPTLKEIVVAEAALPSHRQWDLHPRYDARVGALLLARHHGAALTLQSSLPSLDLASLEISKSEARNPKQGQAVPTPYSLLPTPWQVVSRLPSDPLLSAEILAAVRNAVNAGGSAFVFHDIAGTERMYVCDTCGAWLRCAACDGTLERAGASLQCRVCGASGGRVPNFCPRCNSPHIGPRRVGTERITQDLARALPGILITRLDRDTLPRTPRGPRTDDRSTEADPRSPHPGITVGTERSFAVLGASVFDCIVVLSADRLLEAPAFDAAERFLITLSRLAQHGAPRSALVLQTTHPHLSVVRALAQGDVANWLTEELADRATLRYPPSAALLHLERQFPTAASAENAARRARARLTTRNANLNIGSRVAGMAPRIRAEILLRGPLPSLQRALEHVPAGWSTDPHVPLALLQRAE